MDIEQKKQHFISLLHSVYQAQLTQNANENLSLVGIKRNPNEINIKEKVLQQYGFGERDFWDIICPSLKQEGFLESYEDPFSTVGISREKYYGIFPEYLEKTSKIRELENLLPHPLLLARSMGKSINSFKDDNVLYAIKNIDRLEKEISEWRIRADSNFPHKFVINEHKFDNKKEDKIEIILYSRDNVLEINSIRIPVSKETLERVLLDVLVSKKKAEISWDEILDVYDGDSTIKDPKRKKSVRDSRVRLNKKITNNTVLKQDLIKQRKNNYSLTRKVIKK